MAAADLDRMLHPYEARAIVLAHTQPLEPELVTLDEAGDRFLAAPLIADQDLPPFAASTMDGYAVVHSDAVVRRTVIGSGFAGVDPQLVVQPGTAAKIMTGAPVPRGADAVVRVENTAQDGDQVIIRQPKVTLGENIRPIGSDMRQGDVLLAAGALLGPAEVGLLASLGHARVTVGRRPRVSIFSTGDELVAPNELPGPGQIRDSNRFSLALAARRAGAEVVLNRHVPDEINELRGALHEALARSDAVITSGGVSMGDRDLVKALLGELAEVHFQRVFMKPGKPLNFATLGDTLLFGLPGNPVSCLVGFQLFVRPALQRMQLADAETLPRLPVLLGQDVLPSDRIEYQRATVTAQPDGTLVATVTGSQQSARLMSFVGANAFLIVPPGEASLPAGSRLDALLLMPPASGAAAE